MLDAVVDYLPAPTDVAAIEAHDVEEMLALYRARDRAGVYRKTEHHLVQTLEAIEQEAEAKADPGYWQGQGSQRQGGQVPGGLAVAAPEGSATRWRRSLVARWEERGVGKDGVGP